MVPLPFESLFKRASTTFYNSSLMFPAAQRQDIFTLYAFVRTADDFVDTQPPDAAGFALYCDHVWQSWQGKIVGDPIIDGFVAMAHKVGIEQSWVAAFLTAMGSDVDHQPAQTITDMLVYTYGSAEVIGLMISQIVGAPISGHRSARLLGRAFQTINFVRDIAEDNQLGRRYLPQRELELFGLHTLTEVEARLKEAQFNSFVRYQLQRYARWQRQGMAGLDAVPASSRLPIRLAASSYHWTATQIYRYPLVVFDHKVKPRKRVLSWLTIQLSLGFAAYDRPL